MCAVLTVLGGMLAFFLRHVRLLMTVELANFLTKLNGTYVRTELYEEKTRDTERRITGLEAVAVSTWHKGGAR